MKLLLLLAVVGTSLARPEKLDGLAHQHDHHHHEDAHALPAQHRSASPLADLPEQPLPLPVEEEYQGPPRPYSFTYQAGRYPNHVDRTHSESRGEDGVVVGTFEYLDPLQRPVKVDYTADEYGFHPNVQGPVPQAPKESKAVAAARERHFALAARIAADQARIGEEHARMRAELEAKKLAELETKALD